MCGYADYVIHVHNEDCYKGEDELACTLEEHAAHEHTEACWETEMVLVCGEEAAEDAANAEGTENGEVSSDPESAAEAEAPSDASQAESTEEATSTEAESEESVQPQEPELICELEEHTHDETCIGQMIVCGMDGQPEHNHTVECVDKDGNVICGLEEHIHDANCVDAEGNLICGAEEHRHVVVCYDAEGNEICGKAPHTHGEGCIDAEGNIVCGQEEHEHFVRCYGEGNICGKEEHTHGEECYTIPEVPEEIPESEPVVQEPEAESQEESSQEPEAEGTDGVESAENSEAAHVHTEACYEEVKTLVCGELELHTHDNSCYTEECFDAEGNLIEGSKVSCGLLQLEEHTHTRTEDENSCIKEVELTPEEVAALNQGAKLHIHKEDCYDSDGVLICGHDATHAHMPECYDDAGKTICGYGTAAHVHEKRCYDEEDGSLTCGYETASHVHEESCYDADGNLQCGYETASHVHDESCYDEERNLICGYETAVHVHEKSCYDEEQNLICGYKTAEHVHDESCVGADGNLQCGYETEEHVHDNSCYDEEWNLVCGFGEPEEGETENSGNKDNSSTNSNNYLCGKESHTHNEECWDEDKNLICSLEEHTHTEECFGAEEWAQIEKVNQLISDLPSIEEIKENLAGFGKDEAAPEESVGNVKENEEVSEESEETPEESTNTLEEVVEVVDESQEDSAAEAAESDETTGESTAEPDETTEKNTVEPDETAGEEGGENGNDEYAEELLEQIKEAYDAYMSLDSEQRAQVENVEYLLALWDSLEEIREHARDEGIQGGAESKTYYCGKEEHTHSGDCYDGENNLSCKLEEHTHEKLCSVSEEEFAQIEKVNELIAALPSVEEITEKIAEFQEAGEESEEAYNEYVTTLMAQIQEAYIAYLSLDRDLRECVTGAEYLLSLQKTLEEFGLLDASNNIPDYAGVVPVKEGGNVVLKLLYDSNNEHNAGANPDAPLKGQVNYVGNGMEGYFQVTTTGIPGTVGTVDNVTVSLYFPAEYIDKNSISISQMQLGIDYEVNNIEAVDDQYYKMDIVFPRFPNNGDAKLSFNMKFKDSTVPADYELKIYGTIQIGEEEEKGKTAENVYRPKYDLPEITKYVNTNTIENMKKDETYVAMGEVDENNTVKNNPYVSFWYKIGPYAQYLRKYEKIVLTDDLPVYKDTNGQDRYAAFDQDQNPGWEPIEWSDPEHKIVTKVRRVFEAEDFAFRCGKDAHTHEDACYNDAGVLVCTKGHTHSLVCTDLLKEVEQAELKLRFPECKIDEPSKNPEDKFLTKNLTNHVSMVCGQMGPSQYEAENPHTAEDSIIFKLTSQPLAQGAFTKGNSSNVIADTPTMRNGNYRWGLAFSNNSDTEPLQKIQITDTEIDDRLKFSKIVFDMQYKKGTGQKHELLQWLDRVEAVTYENEVHTYQLNSDEVKEGYFEGYFNEVAAYNYDVGAWTYELALDPAYEYKSFTIYYKEEFELKKEGNVVYEVRAFPYSTFRKPDIPHFVQDDASGIANIYKNKASVSCYTKAGVYFGAEMENQFRLVEVSEKIWFRKTMSRNEVLKFPWQKKDAGDKLMFDKDGNPIWDYDYNFAVFELKGSLSPNKEYKDLRLVDLVPEELELWLNDEGGLQYGTGGEYVKSVEIDTNYCNTGRTAAIMYLDVNKVKEKLDYQGGEGFFSISIKMRVPLNSKGGQYINDAYLLSKDFDDPPAGSEVSKQPDKYDQEGKGTENMIRWSQATGNIQAPEAVYAEKYIAKANTSEWRKNALHLKIGESFQYRLRIVNPATTPLNGLIVYDVLPRTGDYGINGKVERGSEFTVNLTGPLSMDGYEVYYTESTDVYIKDNNMEKMLTGVEWKKAEKISDWKKVTAFKFVALQDTVLAAKGEIDFDIPVKVTDQLEPNELQKLLNKESIDKDTGTAVYLEATNSFGFKTGNFAGAVNKESNYVKVQISLAGFVVKKTNGDGEPLMDAEFQLMKKEKNSDSAEETWSPVGDKVSTNADGIISFKGLEEGDYKLVEVTPPEGYQKLEDPVMIEIRQDAITMKYDISIEGNDDLTGSGTSKDPFIVINELLPFQLPETGGTGSNLYTMAGAIAAVLGAGFLYKRKFRERRA